MEDVGIGQVLEPALIAFTYPGAVTPVMEIKKGEFIWKGEVVEDKYQIYERFNEWMSSVEKPSR